jgi:uncharacterized membrane protein YGL010W
MNAFFLDQMAMYSAYHRDPRNRATHFVGVPAIAFALLVAMARLQFGPLSLAVLFVAAVAAFYLWLDWRLGLPTVAANLPLLALAEWSAGQSAAFGWTLFLACFVGGWAFQLWGHAMEGRKPALLDNLLQALIAPIFLVSEVAFSLGLRRDLRTAVEARA